MRRLELVADCEQCFGLCCVLLPYRAADGFGADKTGGDPCAHLDGHDRCRIHERLRESGWPGCAVFDCLGAGQFVAQETYDGVSWRHAETPGERAEMSAVLSVVIALHRRLARLDPEQPAYAEVLALRDGSPAELLAIDLDELDARIQRDRRQTTTD